MSQNHLKERDLKESDIETYVREGGREVQETEGMTAVRQVRLLDRYGC